MYLMQEWTGLTKKIYGMPTEDQRHLEIINTFQTDWMVKPLFVDWKEPRLGNNSATELEDSAR